jgi:hypothetical protein
MAKRRKRFKFDVALSFAGENRRVVKKLATMLVQAGADVFYDEYKQATLWGKDLYQHLQDIYQNRARYCVVFVSKNYIKKHWAKHELKNAQARAFASHREYILPLRMDSTVLPGLPATVGYLDLKKHDVEEIAVLLLEKLRIPLGDLGEEVARAKWEGDMVPYNGITMASFWPPIIQRAQEHSAYVITRPLERVPYGKEALQWTPKLACGDCGVLPGQYHVRGCDFESCPACGLQALTCPCAKTYLSKEEYEEWVKERCLEGENELIPWQRRNPLPKRYVTRAPARPRVSRKKKPDARKKARSAR